MFATIPSSRVDFALEFAHAHADDHGSQLQSERSLNWRPLEFHCLPGVNVHKRPCWFNFYHSRLEWELRAAPWGAWLSHMERLMLEGLTKENVQQYIGEDDKQYIWASLLSVPQADVVLALIARILAGDDDVADLLATPRSELFLRESTFHGTVRPPTHVRIRWYEFTFSAASAWWSKREVNEALNDVFVFTENDVRRAFPSIHPKNARRRTPPYRRSRMVFVIIVAAILVGLKRGGGAPGVGLKGGGRAGVWRKWTDAPILLCFALFVIEWAGDYQ